jgi:ubiquinone/menaquinone biosynthesis C-methylase UbiE
VLVSIPGWLSADRKRAGTACSADGGPKPCVQLGTFSLYFAMPITDRLASSPLVGTLTTKVWDPLINSALVTKLIKKYWYPLGTRLLGDNVPLFMNWAYEEDPPMALPLETSDEPYRTHIQLYHRTATQADLSGKRVLEVSCGHGGGASYLVRTFRPASYTALDLNPNGIAFCQKRHNLPGLDFVHGNAEDLPFSDQSFDAVINVEASHLYSRFPRFLAEVARVLRPGGYFLYTDHRARVHFAEWETALAEASMRLISERVINEEVIRGLESTQHNTQRLLGPVTRRAPKFVQGLASRVNDMQTSTFCHALRSEDYAYRMYCFTKD